MVVDENEPSEIVEQMRSQMEYARSRNKTGLRISLLFMAVLIAFLAHSTWQSHQFDLGTEMSWDGVYECLDQGEIQEALEVAQELIKSSPHYYYAHSCLADAYLASGDVTNALTHYTTAFQLFPNEAMEKELQAIQLRVKNDRANIE
jgi:Tfp pilus assembly protein PilF